MADADSTEAAPASPPAPPEAADAEQPPGQPPRVSGWAIAALGTSMSFFCPLLSLIGPLLAVRALVEIRARPAERSGRGMALAALWIGVASTLLWIGMMFWWNTHVRGLLLHGPQDAIRAGMAGDIAAFRGAFIGEGATASDDRARVFLDALQQRYGRLVSAAQEQSPATPTPPAAQPATSAPATILQPPASQPGQFSGRSATVPYMLMFEGGNVKADVRITLFAHGLAPAFEWITVKDASQGNLTYP